MPVEDPADLRQRPVPDPGQGRAATNHMWSGGRHCAERRRCRGRDALHVGRPACPKACTRYRTCSGRPALPAGQGGCQQGAPGDGRSVLKRDSKQAIVAARTAWQRRAFAVGRSTKRPWSLTYSCKSKTKSCERISACGMIPSVLQPRRRGGKSRATRPRLAKGSSRVRPHPTLSILCSGTETGRRPRDLLRLELRPHVSKPGEMEPGHTKRQHTTRFRLLDRTKGPHRGCVRTSVKMRALVC